MSNENTSSPGETPKRENWHCLNLNHNNNCTVDCAHEPCIMVPYKPIDIEFLKKERDRMLASIKTIEKKIAEQELANEQALKL